MTQRERDAYREVVQKRMAQYNVHYLRFDNVGGIAASSGIFFMVGPERAQLDERFSNGGILTHQEMMRLYPWATVECWNSRHSDFHPLFSCLWETNLNGIKDATQERYLVHKRREQDAIDAKERRENELRQMEKKGFWTKIGRGHQPPNRDRD
jgi:septin family protein